MLAVGRKAIADLQGKLTRGGKDQSANTGALGCLRRKILQNGQRKGGSFAGACLRTAQKVAPGQYGGNSPGLNGAGAGVTGLGHGFQNGGLQGKVLKCHEVSLLLIIYRFYRL